MLDYFENGQTPKRSYIGPQTLAEVLISLVRAAGRGQALPPILNVAAPHAVEMADLLTAWNGSAPVVRVRANDQALPVVELDVEKLEEFHSFRAKDSAPGEMVRQWLASRVAS